MPAPRPEFENPPDIYYNSDEASRYHVSNRIQTIQRSMTLRALELLGIKAAVSRAQTEGYPPSCTTLLLDIGCGTGISGEVLTEQGHAWCGVDISRDMLMIAKRNELSKYGLFGNTGTVATRGSGMDFSGSATRVDTSTVKWGLITEEDEEEDEYEATVGGGNKEDDLFSAPLMVEVIQNDIGQGIPFRPGSFDGCVSISVLQWLCHSTKKGEVPQRRLMAFFQSLYNALRRGAKAVFQFYPSNPEQTHMITRVAMKCGFGGGVVVDYPHSNKAKKYYLVLQAGQVAGGFVPPPPLTGNVEDENDDDDESDDEDDDSNDESDDESEDSQTELEQRDRVRVGGRDGRRAKRRRSASSHDQRRRKDNRPVTGSREWVLLKKEVRRSRGLSTTADSKYTMRRRKPRF
ncbi:unnamed protein product [Phytomonas sp. EM1]|nr:unnamed protein product [Phytomonas sp. EM1]|eukprot:CCW60677.1 unnamed protein product [Phytomonas sp. isolate EM1]